MPLYHATWRENLTGIMRDGLLPDPPRRNLDCDPGVYLAEDPLVAVAMLLDAYAEAGDPASSPRERAAAVVVVVVDDARLEGLPLLPDPHVEGAGLGTWLCPRRIDVRGATMIELTEAVGG